MPQNDLNVAALSFALLVVLSGCQREAPVENAKSPQPASVVERAAEQAVDAMKTPMDKARGVEGTLEKAVERSAETVKEGGQ